MGKILFIVFMVALAAAFVILLIKKLGWAEWMQIHGDRITSELFSCDFCMSFWTAMVLLLFVSAYFDNAGFLLCAVCTTPITRMLL